MYLLGETYYFPLKPEVYNYEKCMKMHEVYDECMLVHILKLSNTFRL